MDEKFPETLYVSISGSGDDEYMAASKTEQEAIRATDDETKATVAEYRLVAVRDRAIQTTVVDAA